MLHQTESKVSKNLRYLKRKHEVNEHYKVPIIANLIGSGLFLGHIPFASGTIGSLLALGIFLIPGVSEYFPLSIMIVAFFVIGILFSEMMRKRYGEDPPQVIIDEIVGQWLTYLIALTIFDLFFRAKSFNPEFTLSTKIAFGAIGFFLFRFFDIIKLQPAKYFDEQDSGFGIMIDDIAAAVYAGILTAPLTHFLWYKLLVKFFG